ncbi:2-oxoglutarate oxidoreductase subunit KorB, partial [termite gut metagenome]
IRDVEAPSYDEAIYAQIEEVRKKKKDRSFKELLMLGDTWEIK